MIWIAQFYDRVMTKWKPGYGSRKSLTIIITKARHKSDIPL